MPELSVRTPALASRFVPSEEGLRMALNAAHAGIWEWHLDTNQNYWSDEVWVLYGLNRLQDGASYENWLRSVHPEDRALASERVNTASAQRTAFELEWRTNPELGPVRWLLSRGQPGRSRGKGHASYTGIVIDITARKEAEQLNAQLQATLEKRVQERSAALYDHERLLHNILDGIPGMVGYWTSSLHNRFANKAYSEWFGHSPEQIRQRHIRDLLGENLYQQNLPYIQRALRGERQRFERQIPVPGHASEFRHSEAHYVPDIVDGEVRGFLVMVFDISDVKRAELAAEAANRAKSEFLANISHEVRTPLNAMFGLAQVGARNSADHATVHTFEQILGAAQHLLTLVNDVLDFSKIEAGKLALSPERMDLGQWLEDVLSLKAVRAQSRDLPLLLRESTSVPQYCRADPTRLKQVLINLLSNAIKFTDRGHVLLELDYQAPCLVLRVQDTGCGMTPIKQAQLFQPFVQVHSHHPSQDGSTGLGLAITMRIVEMMHGSISVQSAPGRGSTFTVQLPIEHPEQADFTALHRTALLGFTPGTQQWLKDELLARQCQVIEVAEANELHAWARKPALDATPMTVVISASSLKQLSADTIQAWTRAGHQLIVNAPSGHVLDIPMGLQQALPIVNGPLSATRLLANIHRFASKPRPDTAQRLQGLRILAAEDNPLNRLVLGQMLEQEGAQTVFAFDGGHALELVRQHGPQHFSILLCDLQMPILDGYQTAKALSHIAPGLPIIGLTAHAFESAKQQALQSGMVAYVTKPYMLDTLVDEIRRHARKPCGVPAAGSGAALPSPQTDNMEPTMPQDSNDWQAMQLHFKGQPQLLDRLIGMLERTLSEIRGELYQALSKQNFDALAKVAHNIKGTALNLHTPELARLAVQTQDLARQQQAEAFQAGRMLSQHLDAFLEQVNRSLSAASGASQASGIQ